MVIIAEEKSFINSSLYETRYLKNEKNIQIGLKMWWLSAVKGYGWSCHGFQFLENKLKTVQCHLENMCL